MRLGSSETMKKCADVFRRAWLGSGLYWCPPKPKGAQPEKRSRRSQQRERLLYAAIHAEDEAVEYLHKFDPAVALATACSVEQTLAIKWETKQEEMRRHPRELAPRIFRPSPAQFKTERPLELLLRPFLRPTIPATLSPALGRVISEKQKNMSYRFVCDYPSNIGLNTSWIILRKTHCPICVRIQASY
jgi:hypothetical protein